MSSGAYDVPVLMYHSVGVPNKKWDWNYLTCPFEQFEEQLEAIHEMGYQTISLQELHGYMTNGSQLPRNAIAITFDDGYLDVWVYAYGLLKKYGMCATVFINPEFVDPSKGLRKRYCCDGHVDSFPETGFLNWDEIKRMDSEGVIYCESHALTHTWYPISDKIIDFRHPHDPYRWMTWNENVEQKYRLQIDDDDLVRYGQPVYEYGKSLMHRRVFTDQSLDNFIVEYVRQNGGSSFFTCSDYKLRLIKLVDEYKANNKLSYSIETEAEYRERIKHELGYTKDILEERLGREVTYLCWPGGSATDIGMKIAKDLGYKFFNTARDMTASERNAVKNIAFGGIRTKRFAPIIYFNGKEDFDSIIVYAGKIWMKLILCRYKGALGSRILLKLLTTFVRLYYYAFNVRAN